MCIDIRVRRAYTQSGQYHTIESSSVKERSWSLKGVIKSDSSLCSRALEKESSLD